jgi:hypothetical protein
VSQLASAIRTTNAHVDFLLLWQRGLNSTSVA